MLFTTLEADLPPIVLSVVSHLGCSVSDSQVLKIVSLVGTLARLFELGILCTKMCNMVVPRCILIVLGIMWRNVPTSLLSEVALTDSMVIMVKVFTWREMAYM